MTMNHPANRQALYAATLAHFPQHDVNLQAEAFIAGGRATPLSLIEAATIPSLLLQTVIVPGARTNEGTLIEAVALPWFDIIAFLKTDPSIAFQLPWETWEEIIAGAYKKAGFEEVTLTPRSGDHGRDVIAIKKGICSIRVIDQVKAYKPPHLVAANDVRALISVLHGDGASKGCLSTTFDFAPMIKTDPTERRSFRGLKNWRQGRRGKRPSVEPNRIIISVVFVESLNEWAVRKHWQAAAPKWISLSHGI